MCKRPVIHSEVHSGDNYSPVIWVGKTAVIVVLNASASS